MVKSKAGKLSDLKPGMMRGAEVSGKTYLLANVDGTVYAMDGICSHAGGHLYEGKLTGNVVKCPRHGSEFDVKTAKNLKGPWVPFGKAADLRSYKVTVEGDEVFIDL